MYKVSYFCWQFCAVWQVLSHTLHLTKCYFCHMVFFCSYVWWICFILFCVILLYVVVSAVYWYNFFYYSFVNYLYCNKYQFLIIWWLYVDLKGLYLWSLLSPPSVVIWLKSSIKNAYSVLLTSSYFVGTCL